MTAIDPRALTMVTGGQFDGEMHQSANPALECVGSASKAIDAFRDYYGKHQASRAHLYLNPWRNAARDAALSNYQAVHAATEQACAPLMGR